MFGRAVLKHDGRFQAERRLAGVANLEPDGPCANADRVAYERGTRSIRARGSCVLSSIGILGSLGADSIDGSGIDVHESRLRHSELCTATGLPILADARLVVACQGCSSN